MSCQVCHRLLCRCSPRPHFDPPSFQSRVGQWMQECFGAAISADKIERNHRFLEEALELVQAGGCTASEAHQLVDYVYGRPTGELDQEVGGVMVTLAALCLAQGLDMARCGDVEEQRIWGCIEKIRAKQAGKPKHSPLPTPMSLGEIARAEELEHEERKERLEEYEREESAP